MQFLQGLLIKIILGNKEAIISIALSELAKLWAKGKKQLSAKIVEAVKQSPLAATASDEEVGDLLVSIETWFNVPEFQVVEAAALAIFKK